MAAEVSPLPAKGPTVLLEHPVVKLVDDLLAAKGVALTEEERQLLLQKAFETSRKTDTLYDPKREIAIVWTVDDVRSVRPDLSESEAMAALVKAAKDHHTNQGAEGITWDVLKETADQLYQPPEAHYRYVTGTFVMEGGAEEPAYLNLSTGDVVGRADATAGLCWAGLVSGEFVFDACNQPAEKVEEGEVRLCSSKGLAILTQELTAAGARIGSIAELEDRISAPRPLQR